MTFRAANYAGKQRVGYIGMVAIAALATVMEYIFHIYETSPMEVPLYFVAFFIISFVGAFFINRYGILGGAVIMTTLKGIYYAVAVVLNVAGATIWNVAGWFEALGVTASGSWMTVAAAEIMVIEIVVHAVIFIFSASAIIASGLNRA